MNNSEESGKSATVESNDSSVENNSAKGKGKNRGKKRKRRNSESSSEHEGFLPDNSVEVDRNLHASALKNNLDETSVRKIIKKVVTNDRVLALVKMREEEDSGPDEESLRPKLTRAKVKELMKVSPKTTAWNLEKLELTPIKHIPVKTRPEVKALIAQELPEDEDDEEYEPTHDDVPSDDDQGLESCSDLDSQPRTPATPHSQHSVSPKVVKDGPFKVPQDVATPTRRKLDLEEEATIALRTRSKLSLSSTSIEHIESNFVPPDDIPMPDVDDLWNQFLNECLNPASTSKNEDDDETDPEYNVAADPDAHDEDEEALGNSIIKISKKELNDLVTELFNIMPEPTADEDLMAETMANSVLTDNSQGEVSTRWEGKQEVLSDEETATRTTQKFSDRITFEKKNYSRVSSGKSEPQEEREQSVTSQGKGDGNTPLAKLPTLAPKKAPPVVTVLVEEQEQPENLEGAPLLVQKHVKSVVRNEYVQIEVQQAACVLPEQVLLLQQQLRQHVQLATSSFLQLYAHPIHWSFAPKYKEYIETFYTIVKENPRSVANVCNLQAAMELANSWQDSLSTDSSENHEMLRFVQSEAERCMRRGFHKNLYVGEFHETFKKIVANSSVFLYPYLLPSMPFRGDHPRRFCYLYSEDALIALGMEQFWRYVYDNADLYKLATRSGRYGLTVTLQLVAKHMFPWLPFSVLHSHVQNVRKNGDKDNPINKYMATRTVEPVKHKLLPFNNHMTLYEQPEHEVPRIWVRYLAKTSKRFRSYLLKRTKITGVPAAGIDLEFGQAVSTPTKSPLPIDVIQRPAQPADKVDIQLMANGQTAPNAYKLVETSTGAYLVPFTMTVDSNLGPITTPTEVISNTKDKQPETTKTTDKISAAHCTCCVLLRKICTRGQTLISDYFSKRKEVMCFCRVQRYPKVSNRLRLFVNNYKNSYMSSLEELQSKIKLLKEAGKGSRLNNTSTSDTSLSELEDIAFVTKFHLKLLARISARTNSIIKRKIYDLFIKFNPYEHDPLKLATQLDKELGHSFIDVYKEFLCMLNPVQADKLDAFKDYFVRNCMADLFTKVEQQVPEDKRLPILEELKKVYTKNLATACEICTGILATLTEYPDLAKYVHSLFPHRKETRLEQSAAPAPAQKPPQPREMPSDVIMSNDPHGQRVMSETIVDYEADQSMSEDEEIVEDNISEPETNLDVRAAIKTENISMEYTTPTSENSNIAMMVTVSKSEVHDFSESSNSSLRIMFEDEIVKLEDPEWKRDEDKLILEILKEHLTPEERQDKTILETIYDKNIVGMIADSLSDKSKEEIETRIMYLLQIC